MSTSKKNTQNTFRVKKKVTAVVPPNPERKKWVIIAKLYIANVSPRPPPELKPKPAVEEKPKPEPKSKPKPEPKKTQASPKKR